MNDYFKNDKPTAVNPRQISARCPNCGREAVFEAMPNLHDIQTPNWILGIRRCPAPQCFATVFFVVNPFNNCIQTQYPTQLINFNKAGIPETLVATFHEALVCHSQKCFKASALMVRRTLEELCDEKEKSPKI